MFFYSYRQRLFQMRHACVRSLRYISSGERKKTAKNLRIVFPRETTANLLLLLRHGYNTGIYCILPPLMLADDGSAGSQRSCGDDSEKLRFWEIFYFLLGRKRYFTLEHTHTHTRLERKRYFTLEHTHTKEYIRTSIRHGSHQTDGETIDGRESPSQAVGYEGGKETHALVSEVHDRESAAGNGEGARGRKDKDFVHKLRKYVLYLLLSCSDFDGRFRTGLRNCRCK